MLRRGKWRSGLDLPQARSERLISAIWSDGRRRKRPPLKQIGIDEIYMGKSGKFITVVSNLETGEPLWFGRDRKRETLDGFFCSQLHPLQRLRVRVACVDMWEPYKLSIQECAPQCGIVYDKFHVLQHANKAVDEVRRAEFFRQGGSRRELINRCVESECRISRSEPGSDFSCQLFGSASFDSSPITATT